MQFVQDEHEQLLWRGGIRVEERGVDEQPRLRDAIDGGRLDAVGFDDVEQPQERSQRVVPARYAIENAIGDSTHDRSSKIGSTNTGGMNIDSERLPTIRESAGRFERSHTRPVLLVMATRNDSRSGQGRRCSD